MRGVCQHKSAKKSEKIQGKTTDFYTTWTNRRKNYYLLLTRRKNCGIIMEINDVDGNYALTVRFREPAAAVSRYVRSWQTHSRVGPVKA